MSFRYGLQDGSFGVLAVNSSEGPGPAGYLRDLRDLTRCWCVLLNLLLCCNVPYISRPSSAITKMPRNPTLHRVCRALVDCKTGIIGLNVGWAALQQGRKVSVYLSDWATNPMVALLTSFMFQHCMAAYFFRNEIMSTDCASGSESGGQHSLIILFLPLPLASLAFLRIRFVVWIS
jgi:hypothetical protein